MMMLMLGLLLCPPGVVAYDSLWRERRDLGSWIFLERFCFSNSGTYRLGAKRTQEGAYFLVYKSKGMGHFRDVLSKRTTKERVDLAWKMFPANETTEENFRSRSPKFIFIAYANAQEACDFYEGPSSLSYRFRFLNLGEGKTAKDFSRLFVRGIGHFRRVRRLFYRPDNSVAVFRADTSPLLPRECGLRMDVAVFFARLLRVFRRDERDSHIPSEQFQWTFIPREGRARRR